MLLLQKFRRSVLFLIPLLVPLCCAQSKSSAEIDHRGSRIEKFRRKIHRYFGWRGEQNGLQFLRRHGFGRGCRPAYGWFVQKFRILACVGAMFQEHRLAVRVRREQTHRFRPAVTSEPDNTN